MGDVEERRRRLAAMREQAYAQSTNDGTVSSIPSLSASCLSNPLEGFSSDTAATAEVKKPGAPLSRYNGSRHTSPGLSPLPPHLQPAGVHPNSGRSRWQPNVSQRPYSNSGFAPSQPDSDWPPLGHQKPDVKPVLGHPQPPPPQFQPQYVPHRVNQWSNQTVGRDRGREGDTGIGGRFNGRQSRNSPSGESPRDGEPSEGRGAHGRGQGGVRIVSAKEQPGVFVTKKMLETMLEDPWRALEINRMEKVSRRERW